MQQNEYTVLSLAVEMELIKRLTNMTLKYSGIIHHKIVEILHGE